MATPKMVSVRDFNTSRYSQLAETSTANIADILARAEKAIESKIRRPLAPKTVTERFHPTSSTIYLKYRPVISVGSVLRGWSDASVTAPVTAYSINAEGGYLTVLSPVIGYTVDVTYTAGFDPLPEDLREAILMQAAYFAFQDLEFYGSGDAKAPGILYVRDDIEDIIKHYRQINTAYTY